ncbi:hypothetical protein, partial [Segatella buccae]|uniref:hypothetical protein n=1 Tax=Segatella buccae TaxID=28126 RepID=UPI0028E4C16C
KGPQLQRNCGPFSSPFWPFQARFRPLICVSKIQTADYQHIENIFKIAYLRRAGCWLRISKYERPKTNK